MRFRPLCLVAALILTGCGGADHQDLRSWMEASSRDLPRRIPPLPELKPFPIVSYESAGMPDPFSAGRVEPDKKEGGGRKPDFDRPKEQLEAYPLDAIKFIGLVSKGKGQVRHALIQAEGLMFQTGKGNYLGQNFGRITGISDSEITLVEIVQDPTGQTTDWVERQVTLQLHEGAQGKEAKK